jgi:hypothetical protein
VRDNIGGLVASPPRGSAAADRKAVALCIPRWSRRAGRADATFPTAARGDRRVPANSVTHPGGLFLERGPLTQDALRLC